MSIWNSGSHNKYLLVNKNIADDVKRLSAEIGQRHKVNIKYMEVDKDNIHYMIETIPNINLSDFVRTMKSYIAYHIWKIYEPYL